MNRKTALCVVAAMIAAANAHAGFFLVDGKTRGKDVAPVVEPSPVAAPTKSVVAQPQAPAKAGITGRFVVTRCDEPCRRAELFKWKIGASVKTKDLGVMRGMTRVLIVADGSKAGNKKAAVIKELIGKEGVAIQPAGADAGYILIREGGDGEK